MALGITAVYNNAVHSPGFDLSLSGLTGFTTYSVVRQDVNTYFADQTVRGADRVTVSGATAVLSDYETQWGCNNKYVLNGYNSGGTITGTANVTPGYMTAPSGQSLAYPVWIKSPTVPSRSRLIIIQDGSKLSFSNSKKSSTNVLGSKFPVITSDVFGSRNGNFSLIHCYDSFPGYPDGIDITEIIDLLRNGEVLLLQQYDATHMTSDMYFVVDGFDVTQEHRPLSGDPTLTWTINVDFNEVARPDTMSGVVSTHTWQSVNDNNADWTAVSTGYTDWLDVQKRG